MQYARARRAFTLIELLVVIAIIGVIASILLPSLAKSRHTARDTVGKSNLRQAGGLMLAYLNDSRDTFLNPFLPLDQNRPWTAVPDPDGSGFWDFNHSIVVAKTEFFAQYWYSYLTDWRGGGSPVGDEMYSPGDGEQMTIVNTLRSDPNHCNECTLWPSSFLYSPVFWCSKARYGPHDEMLPQDLALNTGGSVSSPSAKVLLWERADFGQQKDGGSPLWNTTWAQTDVLTVDGSMSEIRTLDIMAAIDRGADDLIPTDVWTMGVGAPIVQGAAQVNRMDWPPPAPPPPAYFWATKFGVGGRDFNR